MIASLKGTILQKEDNTLVIDTGNVGYQVTCPTALTDRANGAIQILVYHHITEQGQSLFGFESWEQRNFFKLLIGLSGVGPKVAMKILESVTMDDLAQIIADEDMAKLSKLPGLGVKSAEKVFLELKRKLTSRNGDIAKRRHGEKSQKVAHSPTRPLAGSSSPVSQEISDALKGLGYKDYEIKIALDEIGPQLSKDADTEEGLRLALNALAG